MDKKLKELAIEIFKVDVFKFGRFSNLSGCTINAWFDLLVVLSCPSLIKKISEYANQFCIRENLNCDSVCGVSYAGLPFGVLVASKLQKPLLIWRKEPFYHSTDQKIIGKIFKNKLCLVVEEVACSGSSILAVIRNIQDAGMQVKDVLIIIDLEQGVVENLGKKGFKVHSVLKMSELTRILFDEKLITSEQRNDIIEAFSDQFSSNSDCITNTYLGDRRLTRYEYRVNGCKSKIGKKLLKLMSKKQSNLCVEFIDLNMDAILQAAELSGPHICVLTICWNMFRNDEFKLKKLIQISKTHNFLLMDDSKLSEDGNVLNAQCRYRFKYVDLLTIYAISGENTLLSAKSIIENEFPEKGIFVVACPNIANEIIGTKFETNSIKVTLDCFEEITGFISNKNSKIPLDYIHMRSDLRNSEAGEESSKNDSFYSGEVIISDIAADVVQLRYNSLENINNLIEKERLLLWNAYIKRLRE